MKSDNEKNFVKALACIHTGRKYLCRSLIHIQNTPILDKKEVLIISEAIDSIDRSVSKLKASYSEKTEWVD